MVALLVDIGQFIIRLHEWLVAPVCEVEGHAQEEINKTTVFFTKKEKNV